MITLVFMTDLQRVVGGSTRCRNLARMPFLPMSKPPQAMNEIMAGQHMVIGSGSKGFYAGNAKQYTSAWLLTRQYQQAGLGSGLKVCNDLQELVRRYQDSDDELLVLGGLTVWNAFLPYPDRIRTAETYKDVPGDFVFDAWDQGDFTLVKDDRRKKLAVREYLRARGGKKSELVMQLHLAGQASPFALVTPTQSSPAASHSRHKPPD